MFAVGLTQTLLLHQYFQRCFVTGMHIRTGLIAAIYQKALRLSLSARQTSTIGEIVNHMSVDAQRLLDICGYFHILWSGPFQIIVALVLLHRTLGASVFAGVALMLLMIPINGLIAARSKALQKVQMTNKDNRLKLMDEILAGMKAIKLYAWEDFFQGRIMQVRNEEIRVLRKVAYMSSLATFLWISTPFLVSVFTFGTYVLVSDAPLTTTKAFTSLALFNLLAFPLSVFPMVINAAIEASVALKRLHGYLAAEEVDPFATHNTESDGSAFNNACEPGSTPNNGGKDNSSTAIRIDSGTFAWNHAETSIALQNISVVCLAGQLTAVVGQVGAGKSALLNAMLGELVRVSGRVSVRGTVAYVPQQAWIMNATLRENILFGRPLEAALYEEVLDCCALRRDLAILQSGDQTEIGERGINLSGGQKQRVSIARAVYARASIYLMDDPLSAVDSHVGRHIFESLLGPQGLLHGRTRVLATHSVQFLPIADQILFMKNGTVHETGTYTELMRPGSDFYAVLNEHVADLSQANEGSGHESSVSEGMVTPPRSHVADTSAVSIDGSDESEKVSASNRSSKQSLSSESATGIGGRKAGAAFAPLAQMTKEEQSTGQVALAVYFAYAQSIGILPVLVLLLFYATGPFLSIASNFWLAYWSAQNGKAGTNEQVPLYLGIYAALGVTQSLFVVLQTFVAYIICGLRAATFLHNQMLERIFRAPMEFFDTTPLVFLFTECSLI